MKKIFLFAMGLLAMTTTAFSQPAVDDVFTVDGLQYKVKSMASGAEKVWVTQQEWTSASLVIPATVTYSEIEFLVEYVDQRAFQNNTTITSLDVAAQKINSFAFDGCSNLTDVTLREGVTTLYRDAFEGIAATSITLPASLKDLDEYGYFCPFSHNNLTEFVVAEGNPYLTVGEDGALYNKAMTRIYAFPFNCPKKFKEILPSVEIISTDVFASCTNIADTIIIPATLKRAASFHACSNIKYVVIESKSTSFSDAFQNCGGIEEIVLGKGVDYLGQIMFWNCRNVRKITVLSETMPVWQYGTNTNWPAFNDVGTLFADCKVYVHCGQSATYEADDYKWANFTNIIDTLLYDVDVDVPNATYTVEPTSECNQVKVTVTPNDGFTFVNWDNGEIANPLTLTVTSDTMITANVKKNLGVGDTFRSNTVEGVPVLYKVLTNAAGDKTVQVGDYSSFVRPNAIAKATAGEVTIPDSAVYFDEKFEVVKIDQYAFYTCNSVTALHLPNTITLIDALGVNELTGLKEVNIPNALERTGRYNFAYMNVLKSITIPSSVKYLDYGTFASNYVLEEIVGWDPSKIERMGRIQWYTNSPIWNNTDYFQTENDIRYMGDIAISLPNSESIEVKEGTRVVVGGSTISACKNISIPSTVEAMSAGVIYQCTLLETCTIKAVTPPLIYDAYDVMTELDANGLRKNVSGTYPPYGSNPTPEDVKYYVPKEAVATYKASDKWNIVDIRPIGGWTVSFRDHNQNNIIAPQNVEQGTAANRPESVETYYTEAYMYVFADEWTATIVNTGDTIYDAVYDQLPLPMHYVCFYETEEDAQAQTNRKYRVEKTHFESAEANAAIAVTKLTPKECQMVTGWNGGDITNVTEELHVWPAWGDGKYSVIFFDPIGDAAIKTYENKECGDGVDGPLESEIPVHAGKRFTGWDTDAWQYLEHMLGDLTVNAVYVDDATGFGSVDADSSVQKVMIDGQLYILRDGKTYNAQGVELH